MTLGVIRASKNLFHGTSKRSYWMAIATALSFASSGCEVFRPRLSTHPKAGLWSKRVAICPHKKRSRGCRKCVAAAEQPLEREANALGLSASPETLPKVSRLECQAFHFGRKIGDAADDHMNDVVFALQFAVD